MTPVTEARRAWRGLLAAHRPQTREEKLRLVRALSLEHRAAILAEIVGKKQVPLDDPNTLCYIYVHEE